MLISFGTINAVKKFKNRKKNRPRPPMKYDCLVIAMLPFTEKI